MTRPEVTTEQIMAFDRANPSSRDTIEMLLQAQQVKQLLAYCSYCPGATIKISVTTDRSTQHAEADLYDHAALVDSLYNALDYFQAEMM